jgi:hypothetical protein
LKFVNINVAILCRNGVALILETYKSASNTLTASATVFAIQRKNTPNIGRFNDGNTSFEIIIYLSAPNDKAEFLKVAEDEQMSLIIKFAAKGVAMSVKTSADEHRAIELEPNPKPDAKV